MIEERPLYAAVLELKTAVDRVVGAGYQGADNALKRMMSLMAPGTTLGALSERNLPHVDFATWYASANATMTSMVGSGELDLPLETRERVAIQLELLREVARSTGGVRQFCFTFLHPSDSYDVNVRAFATEFVVPFYNEWLHVVKPELEAEEAAAEPSPTGPEPAPNRRGGLAPYVDPDRIADLRALSAPVYDVAKIVRMCEEMNLSWQHDCYFAVGMLARALIDHVAPIFGVPTFAQVASNVSGSQSFRASMDYLDKGARKISDSHLHSQIRKVETLPGPTQVDFSRELDVLLAEIIRLLK